MTPLPRSARRDDTSAPHTDANVLINLMHVARLDMCGRIPGDEKKRFRREAEARIGKGRLLGTAELFVLAIRDGLLTVEDADADKAVLEQRRFKMPFASFREFVG